MENLEYDPRTKQIIRDSLFKYLYDPVERHFKTRLDDIIDRNCVLGPYSHRSFSYKGQFYTADIAPPPIRKNRLVPQLRADMEKYLADKRELNEQEIPYVLGYINQVLNSSDSLTDYLRLLPTSIHRPLQELAKICPCQAHKLEQAKVDQLKERNDKSIRLLKRRLVTNLLL